MSVTDEQGGANVNEPAEGGATALHYAVSGGHDECTRVLLQYGADINSLTSAEEVRVGTRHTVTVQWRNCRRYTVRGVGGDIN